VSYQQGEVNITLNKPSQKNTRDLILLQKPHILPFPKGGAPAIFFKQGLRYSNNQQTTRCSQYHTLNKLNQQKASDRRVLQHPHNLPFPKGGAPADFFQAGFEVFQQLILFNSPREGLDTAQTPLGFMG